MPESSVFNLRSEDFIAAPQETLRRLSDLPELPFEPALLDIDLSRHNIGRYRKNSSQETVTLTEETLSDWMHENNYATSG